MRLYQGDKKKKDKEGKKESGKKERKRERKITLFQLNIDTEIQTMIPLTERFYIFFTRVNNEGTNFDNLSCV